MTVKIANFVIVGLVVVGTVFLGTLVQASGSGQLMPTLFLGFFAIVIVFQVAPALMLFGAMVKEIFRRRPAKGEAHSGREG